MTKQWYDHLEDIDDLAPLDNISNLSDAKLFIGHGKLDKCVHYSKSVNYFNKILEAFPNKKEQFKLKLYSDGDHSKITSNQACIDFLTWVGINKV